MAMVVLVVVALGGFAVGAYAAARWLPPLADGPVAGVALFVVCGLAGASLGLLALDIDSMVRELSRSEYGRGAFLNETIVAQSLLEMFRDSGSLAGLALIGYLLAPRRAPARADAPAPPPAAP